MSDWRVEPRPVPAEVLEGFRAEPFRDPFMVPVLEKLSVADLEKLSMILGGWPILPPDTTE